MVSTRSRSAAPTPSDDKTATTNERPSKRVKRETTTSSSSTSSPPPPSLAITTTKSQAKTKVKTKSDSPIRQKNDVTRVLKQDVDEEIESEESIRHRKRNVGKKFSPGDGQLDYTLTEPEPYRNPKTFEFLFPDYPRFKPNLSPREILERGSFDGGYFKPVYSKRSKRELHEDWNDLPEEWIEGIDVSKYLTRPEGAEDSVNKWQANMGQGYEAWEANGWIVAEHDARGWMQWYYRFFMGRRCEDDERQVGRWDRVAGESSGRWRRIFLEKYRKNKVYFIEPNEEFVSPGIRQTLNHWAFDPTTDALNRFREEKGDQVANDDADELN